MAVQSDEKEDTIIGADAWVVVGSTGTGKSSFVNLFSSKHAKVSGSGDSCTKQVAAYPSISKNGNKFVLIDTIGYDDSDGITDEESFMSILRFIHEHGFNSVILFWCINPSNRASGTLQKQAKFINSFRDLKIWESTVIIVREATPATLKKQSGVCDAIKKTFQNQNDDVKNYINKITQCIPKIGYKCIDWLDDDVKDELPESSEKRHKSNILDKNGVRELIFNNVKDIKGCQVIFMTDKCIKCGEIGDRRILSPKCHFGNKARKIHPSLKLNEFTHLDNNIYYNHKVLKPILKHKNEILITKYKHNGILKKKEEPIQIEYYHSGKLETYHGGNIKQWHKGELIRYHSGELISCHKSEPVPFHPGKVSWSHCGKLMLTHPGEQKESYHPENTEWYHSGRWLNHAGSRWASGILTIGISEIWRRGEWSCCTRDYEDSGCRRRYSCCDADVENNPAGCHVRRTCCPKTQGDAKGCTRIYTCCQNSQDSEGCKGKIDCCNKQVIKGNNVTNIQGSPCETKYLCCNTTSISTGENFTIFRKGCKKKWTCCNSEEEKSIGCKAKWNCCNSEVIGKGGKYSLNGCENKCSQCDELWTNKENGCNARYICCKGNSASKGCQQRDITIYGDYLYTCCNRGSESQGCYSEQFYQCCNKLIGTNGCGTYYTCCNKFKFEDINQGCVEYYKCCNSTTNSDMANGCVLKCCKEKRLNLNEESGCTDVCSKCDGLWNDPNCKGCGIGKDYQHQVEPLK